MDELLPERGDPDVLANQLDEPEAIREADLATAGCADFATKPVNRRALARLGLRNCWNLCLLLAADRGGHKRAVLGSAERCRSRSSTTGHFWDGLEHPYSALPKTGHF